MSEDRDYAARISTYRTVTQLIADLVDLSPHDWDRRQAINLGLLLRIRGLMSSVLDLVQTSGNGEAVFALTRMIYESATNVRYLILTGQPDVYSQFVRTALKADVALLDEIEKRIAKRGTGEMPIEASMKASVQHYVHESDTTMRAVRESARGWGGTYYQRLKALQGEDAYPALVAMQLIPSSAVHGDWSDLLRFHLHKTRTGYRPGSERVVAVNKILGPTALLVCEALLTYLRAFRPEQHTLIDSIEELIASAKDAESESGDFET